MSTKIVITINGNKLTAQLNDSAAAKKIASVLPKEISMSRWGEEYYGSIGAGLRGEKGVRDVLEVGELAYWPPGDALCFFFGPTPASKGNEPRAASDVVPLGSFDSGTEMLKGFSGSIRALIELA